MKQPPIPTFEAKGLWGASFLGPQGGKINLRFWVFCITDTQPRKKF